MGMAGVKGRGEVDETSQRRCNDSRIRGRWARTKVRQAERLRLAINDRGSECTGAAATAAAVVGSCARIAEQVFSALDSLSALLVCDHCPHLLLSLLSPLSLFAQSCPHHLRFASFRPIHRSASTRRVLLSLLPIAPPSECFCVFFSTRIQPFHPIVSVLLLSVVVAR